jgi:hypothetical protein
MVGFHDILCVLLSGHSATVKLSSNDKYLVPGIIEWAVSFLDLPDDLIEFTVDKISDFDAIIATGSDNTSRYFEYYFGRYPNIIRRNRNGVAVLTGDEGSRELEMLGEDIFRYFGLGCRNVSKVFIPSDYNLSQLFDAFGPYREIAGHSKYMNNYDYQKSILLINNIDHYDPGFVLFKEDTGLSSPISVVYFEKYDDIGEVKEYLEFNRDGVQCVVSSCQQLEKKIPPGKSQEPALWDYSDNVDVMSFLAGL